MWPSGPGKTAEGGAKSAQWVVGRVAAGVMPALSSMADRLREGASGELGGTKLHPLNGPSKM